MYSVRIIASTQATIHRFSGCRFISSSLSPSTRTIIVGKHLYFNFQNGNIATDIQKWESDSGRAREKERESLSFSMVDDDDDGDIEEETMAI